MKNFNLIKNILIVAIIIGVFYFGNRITYETIINLKNNIKSKGVSYIISYIISWVSFYISLRLFKRNK